MLLGELKTALRKTKREQLTARQKLERIDAVVRNLERSIKRLEEAEENGLDENGDPIQDVDAWNRLPTGKDTH